MTGPADWDRPAWLLVALVLVVGVAGAVGASTSTSAYGTFNPAWDGGTDLRAAVAEAETEPYVVLETTDYDALDPTATAVVVLSPTEPYDDAARARLATYVENGGTLVVAEDFRPHANPLLDAVGARARVTGEPLRDNLRNTRTPAFPLATNVSRERSGADESTEATLTRDVDALALNHPSTVAPNGATVLVASSRFGYHDTNRNATLDAAETVRRYPVVTAESVGAGRVVVVSDPSLFINAMQPAASNRQFVQNVAAPHDRVGVDHTHTGGQPPLAVALVRLQHDPLVHLVVGVVGLGAVLLGSRYAGRVSGAVDTGSVLGGTAETGRRDPATAQRVQAALLRSRESTAKSAGTDESDQMTDDE